MSLWLTEKAIVQVSFLLQKAKKAGIKIIVVDAPVSKEVAVDTTIVSDNYQAGVLIAKDMMKTFASCEYPSRTSKCSFCYGPYSEVL